MNKVLLGKKEGINWDISLQLEDIDFADDIKLKKTWKTQEILMDLIKINCQRNKLLRINVECNKNLQITGENVKEV